MEKNLLQVAKKGAIAVLSAPITLPVTAVMKIWQQACTDINPAGASFIVHGSIATIAGLFFLLTSKNRREIRFVKMVDITQELSYGGEKTDDKSRAHRRNLLAEIMNGNLPNWVEFPDWEKAPFLQALLSAAWPGIDSTVSSYLRELITSSLEENLKGYGTVSLNALEFGSRPFTISGVNVKPLTSNTTKEIESLVLYVSLKWAGKPTLEVSFSPPKVSSLRVGAAVRYLQFSGVFRLELNGIKRSAPYFNKWSISMLSNPKPTLDFDFRFLGFVGNALLSSVENFLPDFKDFLLTTALAPITYPEVVGSTIGDDTDPTGDRVARPLGVLEVEVVAGELAQRTGFLGRKRELNPRISLLLPPVTTTAQWEDERIKQTATAGVFTKVAENSDRTPSWQNQRFQLVVTSRSQTLQVLLSHKRSFVGAHAQMEPMKWDKPLGSVALPLDEIIPEYFLTPPATPPPEHNANKNKTPADTGAVASTSNSKNDASNTLDAEVDQLTALLIDQPVEVPTEIKDRWIEVKPTEHKVMSAQVDEATGEKENESSMFYGTEEGQQIDNNTSLREKIAEALQSQMLDPDGHRAFDDWDWSTLMQSDKDNVHLKLRWRPLKEDSSIKIIKSFKLDFTAAELEEEHRPLEGICPKCTHAHMCLHNEDEWSPPLKCPNVAVHPVPKSPLLESSKGRLEAALARRHALDQVGMVTGVLAVFVERSKLHFGKNSAIPTMAVSVAKAVENIGFQAVDQKLYDLPSPAISLKCRERNQHGSLEWGQTFYLPISVGSNVLQHGGLVVQLDLGGIKPDAGLFGAGVGTWKRGQSGHGILALDAYDSYDKDVEVIAMTQYELKRVVDAGREGISEKLIFSEPVRESGKFWEGGRKIANRGKVKVKFAWYPVS